MAQLVAHLLCKQRVAGSNPASSTESFILDSQQQKIPQKCGIFCMCACFMRRCSCIWNNLFNYECNHECNYECIYGCNHWCNHEKLFAQKKRTKKNLPNKKTDRVRKPFGFYFWLYSYRILTWKLCRKRRNLTVRRQCGIRKISKDFDKFNFSVCHILDDVYLFYVSA